MIKAITFDLDGVYFPDGKANFIKALGELGVSESEAKRVFLKSDEMNQQYKLGHMTDEQFWSWAASEWGIDQSPDQLAQLLIQGYSVDPKVQQCVKKVRSRNYKTLVCSNNFPARVEGLQARFSFLNDFDAAVFSYEIGASKPSSNIFNELVHRAGVPAETIVFADDDETNVAGAQAAGITAFVYENFGQFTDQLTELGVDVS